MLPEFFLYHNIKSQLRFISKVSVILFFYTSHMFRIEVFFRCYNKAMPPLNNNVLILK